MWPAIQLLSLGNNELYCSPNHMSPSHKLDTPSSHTIISSYLHFVDAAKPSQVQNELASHIPML